MFECPICKDWLYVSKLCEKCVPIRNIVALVGIEEVADVLNDVFLRTDNGIKEKKNRVVKTRSQKAKEEQE